MLNFQRISISLEPLTVDSSIALGIIGEGGVVTAVDFVAAETEVTVQASDEDLIGQATVDVDVSSDSDGGGFTLTLSVVAGASSTFIGSFVVSDTTDPTNAGDPGAELRPMLEAIHGDELIASYTETDPPGVLTDTIELDSQGPDITNLLPPDGTLSNDFTPRFTVDVTENGSGVDVGSINFLESAVQLTDAAREALVIAESFDELPPTGTQVITDRFSAETILDLPNGTKFVGVVASDLLGNVSAFDVDDGDADKTLSEITAETTVRLGIVDGEFIDVDFAKTGTAIIVQVDDDDLNSDPSVSDFADVHVASDGDPTGFILRLGEINPDSGVFLGIFVVASSTDQINALNPLVGPRPSLKALHGDEITARYDDQDPEILREDSLVVDDEAPVIENFIPEDDSVLDDELVDFSADILDEQYALTDLDDLRNTSTVLMISTVQCADADLDGIFALLDEGSIFEGDLVAAIQSIDCDGFGGPDIAAIALSAEDFQAIEGGLRLEAELLLDVGLWFVGIA